MGLLDGVVEWVFPKLPCSGSLFIGYTGVGMLSMNSSMLIPLKLSSSLVGLVLSMSSCRRIPHRTMLR